MSGCGGDSSSSNSSSSSSSSSSTYGTPRGAMSKLKHDICQAQDQHSRQTSPPLPLKARSALLSQTFRTQESHTPRDAEQRWGGGTRGCWRTGAESMTTRVQGEQTSLDQRALWRRASGAFRPLPMLEAGTDLMNDVQGWSDN